MDADDDLLLIPSSRSVSGYKHVIYDGRSRAKNKPWSVSHKSYRSSGFKTAKEAAIHQAKRLLRMDAASSVKAKRLSSRTRATRSTRVSVCASATDKCPSAGQSLAEPVQRALHGSTPVAPSSGASASPVVAPPAIPPPVRAADWMQRKGVRFNVDACNLFGARILMRSSPKQPFELAVIKSWTPCSSAPFGIVFDSKPDHVFDEDLLRKGRRDWKLHSWEGDIWDTHDRRPICPTCGHPLDVGRDAWTRCPACHAMEPGASSFAMHSRTRSDDPYRRGAVSYAEYNEDE